MKRKVWIVMESWSKELSETFSMGFSNSVYGDYSEAVKAKENLMEFNKKYFPNDFYTNWIVESMLYYAK